MVAVRTLGEADLGAAVAIVAHGVQEIPLYRWLLGDAVDDREKREWLARILLVPLLRAGCIAGAERDGALLGVIAWQPHDVDLAADGRAPVEPEGLQVIASAPELGRRLVALWTEPPLPPPVADGVNVVLAAVVPDARGGTVLAELARPIEDYCRTADRPAYVWTGSARLRDWFLHGWHGVQFAERDWNGVPTYGFISGRPPVGKGPCHE